MTSRHFRIAVNVIAALFLVAPSMGAQVSGISARVLVLHVRASQLPTPTGAQGLRIVTDAMSEASCTVGGGTVKLVCFDNGTWVVVGLGVDGSQGPTGPEGDPGPAGEDGVDGANGQAATIAVGDVATGAAGSSASVVNSGTSSAAVLDFAIPRGDKGDQGDAGAQGSAGPTGATGATGPQGTQGSPGEDGAIGATGPTGPTGLTGDVGPAGSAGAAGATGPTGATGVAGPVAGSTTQVIFNDAGAAAGDAGLTYSKTADALTVAGQVTSPILAGGTASAGDLILKSTTHATHGRVYLEGTGSNPALDLGMRAENVDGTATLVLYAGNLAYHGHLLGQQIGVAGQTTVRVMEMNSSFNAFFLSSGSYLGWSSGSSISTAPDTKISRGGAAGLITLQNALRLTPIVSPPVACGAGAEGVVYTDTSHALCYCNGTAYANLTPADGGTCL